MKKIIALLICAAALLTVLAGCGEKNIVFFGTVEEVFDKSILVTTTDDVGFDKASVSFDPKMKRSFELKTGQLVKVTIRPQIAESYPVQVTAVNLELVSEPASPDPAQADYAASFFRADSHAYGGWDFIVAWAANGDRLITSSARYASADAHPKSSDPRIPVVVIDNAAALSDFISEGIAYFQFDIAYADNVSFSENAGKYDAAFFERNRLLILYTQEPSGSIRHKITSTAISGDTLSVEVETIVPEIGTDDIADWFILLEFQNDEVAGVSKYDACDAPD